MFYIEVKPTPKMGNGVFACKDFSKGDIIEICPVVVVPDSEKIYFLDYWFFEWEQPHQNAMLLGYGMIYNHSDNPNATYELNIANKIVEFTALKNIKKGQQIFINYNFSNQKYIPMLDPKTHKPIKVKLNGTRGIQH